MSDLKVLAHVVLDTHGSMEAASVVEPVSDADGMPLDPDAWQRWYDTMWKPAYAAWDKAIRKLAVALGTPDMSRHPFNFKPLCIRILSEDVSHTVVASSAHDTVVTAGDGRGVAARRAP